jgi:hypothetical protein
LYVFAYLPRAVEEGHELLNAVAPIVAEGRLEVYYDLQRFAARIRRPKDPSSVAIVWDPTREDLRNIGAMRPLLEGIRTLLVLPDEDAETVVLAHKLLPAYIAYIDDGITEIVSVLERLAASVRSGPLVF